MDLWLTSVGVLARSLAKDECQPLRDSALMALRCGVQVACARVHVLRVWRLQSAAAQLSRHTPGGVSCCHHGRLPL